MDVPGYLGSSSGSLSFLGRRGGTVATSGTETPGQGRDQVVAACHVVSSRDEWREAWVGGTSGFGSGVRPVECRVRRYRARPRLT